ncbi:MAG: hypothetical protein LPJ89_06065 [Hymenobacteraceae bacterium]|nr:hypothetical protein [Hymenobacteraceae bacterium]MDX5396397.1 hypothetical protein [Hymenobacteraceae bacterium]MDX5443335.1 hypothetical protein [Hymenobacteraceae bacterium]MDX5512459.1 hypothetical protein [Hymenobacteraceae bacterium]
MPTIKHLPLWQHLLLLLSVLALVVFRWGYEFGRFDQTQVLSYAQFLNNPQLYPHDFYLQNIHQEIPNERYFFAVFLSWFGDWLEPASFVLFVATTLLLFQGLYKLSAHFIQQPYLRYLPPLILFWPLYFIGLGSNELYYNNFFVSNVVKVMGLFGLLYLLRNKLFVAFALAAVATLLQPVNGIQLFVTFSGILILSKLWSKTNLNWKQIFLPILLYCCTGLVHVLLLKFKFSKEAVSNERFFQILFEFRAPHHYLPSAFSWKVYLLFSLLFLIAMWFYFRRSIPRFVCYVISIIGCAVTVVGVEIFRMVDIASLQWFKTTIWLEAFSVIALVALAEQLLPWLQQTIWQKITLIILPAAAAFAVFMMLFFQDNIPWRQQVTYDFGSHYQSDFAVDIALQARKKTPEDALFIYPINYSELKYYGRRSSYVDYKILVHRQDKMLEWHERIKEIYGVSADGPYSGFSVFPPADQFFTSFTENDLKTLRQKHGITHILTFATHELGFPVEAENKEWKIYQIP